MDKKFDPKAKQEAVKKPEAPKPKVEAKAPVEHKAPAKAPAPASAALKPKVSEASSPPGETTLAAYTSPLDTSEKLDEVNKNLK